MFGTTRRIFLCTNKRVTGQSCGTSCDTDGVAEHLQRLLEETAAETGDIELRKTRCLGRCPLGPVLGILPDNVWYAYRSRDDLDEVVSEHLVGGRQVERLLVRRAQRSA
jgi:(2Fe-2S) ferredoxin